MTHLAPRPALPLARQLTVLRQTYPAWNIGHRRGMWSAVRVTPPTPAEAAAGMHRYIVQPSLEALAAVLSYQTGIAQGA